MFFVCLEAASKRRKKLVNVKVKKARIEEDNIRESKKAPSPADKKLSVSSDESIIEVVIGMIYKR